MLYPINEIFQSLQGEGYFTNVPAIFIRLQGCPVACSWCDTKHTWDIKKDKEIDIQGITVKTVAKDTWSNANEQQLVAICKEKYQARHVVITGGEPCLYDLQPLTSLLEENGYRCQIETSGTHPVRCSTASWVTVSPKIGMKGGLKLLDQALQRADEIKHPVARERDIERLNNLLDKLNDGKKPVIALQPIRKTEKESEEATKLCIETCIKHNWRLSVQMHKYLKIR
ncbi:7-carboxy-7-deazaguanine synthase QueE [Candidatus Regiella insecticola]|nr:7-carboxy-7-deazaguanine synthase QueE [Candidatus Regiella insecticola]